MSLSPYEEAALCRESSRLRDAAARRLDGETVAFGFPRERKALRKERRQARRAARHGRSAAERRPAARI